MVEPSQIELKLIDQVAKICQLGSFSEAARRLGLSQPALSKSISQLELRLGARLFDRGDGGSATPTEVGALLAERGQPLLASAEALRRELGQRLGVMNERLRIGVGPTTRLKPLPQVVRGLLADHPHVSVEARVDSGLKIMRGVQQGRFDLAFGHSENADPYGDLIRVKLFEDRMVAVARPGHPATLARAPLTASELLQYPMASVGPTRGFRDWAGELTETELANASALVCDDMELLQHSLVQNYSLRGVRFVFERALAAGELVEIPITWAVRFECWMLTTQQNWRSPLVKAVAEMARAAPVDCSHIMVG